MKCAVEKLSHSCYPKNHLSKNIQSSSFVSLTVFNLATMAAATGKNKSALKQSKSSQNSCKNIIKFLIVFLNLSLLFALIQRRSYSVSEMDNSTVNEAPLSGRAAEKLNREMQSPRKPQGLTLGGSFLRHTLQERQPFQGQRKEPAVKNTFQGMQPQAFQGERPAVQKASLEMQPLPIQGEGAAVQKTPLEMQPSAIQGETAAVKKTPPEMQPSAIQGERPSLQKTPLEMKPSAIQGDRTAVQKTQLSAVQEGAAVQKAPLEMQPSSIQGERAVVQKTPTERQPIEPGTQALKVEQRPAKPAAAKAGPPGRLESNFEDAKYNEDIPTNFTSDITEDDIFIAVKTGLSNHRTRLQVILDTWFSLGPKNVWFFTDAPDPEVDKLTSRCKSRRISIPDQVFPILRS